MSDRQLTPAEVKHFANHPQIQAEFRRQIEGERTAAAEEATSATRVYLGRHRDGSIPAVGTDHSAIFNATRKYGWDQRPGGQAWVHEYDSQGNHLGCQEILLGTYSPTRGYVG